MAFVLKTTNKNQKITVSSFKKAYNNPLLHIPKVEKNGKKVPTVEPGKRWYIYFYFENPTTKKRQFIKYKRGINKLKTVKERKAYGQELCVIYLGLLKDGFSPFNKDGITYSNNNANTVKKAVNYALNSKKPTLKPSTFTGYEAKVNVFLKWCDENGISNLPIQNFTFNNALSFINSIKNNTDKKLVGTSIHNYKRDLSAIFSKLLKDRIVEENFFASIETKMSKPKRHKPFTPEQVVEIKKYLLKNDLHLYYFITIMLYSFLRNKEVVSLKVGDIDLKRRVLSIETKTEVATYKLITNKVYDLFVNVFDITKKPLDHFVISHKEGKTGYWSATENVKKRVFSERFNKVKKALKLDDDYTIYSFRHTIITDLFLSLIKSGLTEHEAIIKLMSITGHYSETALRKYLRSIGAILPKEYSNLYTIDF